MIEDDKLGVKVAADTDEAFWTDTKEKVLDSNKAEARNAKVREVMLELCNKELS
jgi:hypothetical protein